MPESSSPVARQERATVHLDPAAGACPACGGEGNYLGRLGARDWYRCRSCGADFSTIDGEHAEAVVPDVVAAPRRAEAVELAVVLAVEAVAPWS